MKSIENLFTTLKEIYDDKVYDIDKQVFELKEKGWFINENTKRPDFLILDFENRDILIEVKTITEQENDIKLKEDLLSNIKSGKGAIGFYVPEIKEKIGNLIRGSNKQFKEFVKNEVQNLKENISTILVIYCERFSLNNTIDEIDEIIYGIIHQEWKFSEELVLNVKFDIKDKVLNVSRYTSTSFTLLICHPYGIFPEKNS